MNDTLWIAIMSFIVGLMVGAKLTFHAHCKGWLKNGKEQV